LPFLERLSVIDVVFQFCCIHHGISFVVAMVQAYQKSIGYNVQKTENARAS